MSLVTTKPAAATPSSTAAGSKACRRRRKSRVRRSRQTNSLPDDGARLAVASPATTSTARLAANLLVGGVLRRHLAVGARAEHRACTALGASLAARHSAGPSRGTALKGGDGFRQANRLPGAARHALSGLADNNTKISALCVACDDRLGIPHFLFECLGGGQLRAVALDNDTIVVRIVSNVEELASLALHVLNGMTTADLARNGAGADFEDELRNGRRVLVLLSQITTQG